MVEGSGGGAAEGAQLLEQQRLGRALAHQRVELVLQLGRPQPLSKQWGSQKPYSSPRERAEEADKDELMEASPEPVVLREAPRRRQRSLSSSSKTGRSRTPPRLDPVPPEGIEIVGARPWSRSRSLNSSP